MRINIEDEKRLKMAYRNYKTFEHVWGKQDARTKCSLRSLILLKREYVESNIEMGTETDFSIDNCLNIWEYKRRQVEG